MNSLCSLRFVAIPPLPAKQMLCGSPISAARAHLEHPLSADGHPVQSFSNPPLSSKLGRGLSLEGIRGHRPRCASPPRTPTVCHGHPVQSFSNPPLSSKLGRGLSLEGIRGHRPRCASPPRTPTVCHGHPVQSFYSQSHLSKLRFDCS